MRNYDDIGRVINAFYMLNLSQNEYRNVFDLLQIELAEFSGIVYDNETLWKLLYRHKYTCIELARIKSVPEYHWQPPGYPFS